MKGNAAEKNRKLFRPKIRLSNLMEFEKEDAEMKMTFQEFTLKYRGAYKSDGQPYVFPADIDAVAGSTGLDKAQIVEWISAWYEIQAAYVKERNCMPSIKEIIAEYNRAHGIVEPSPPPPIVPIAVPPRDPAATVGTMFGRYQPPRTVPTGVVCLAQLTVDQFVVLMHELMDQHSAPVVDEKVAMRAKLQAALAALE